MNRSQRTALTHHCRLAGECVNVRFRTQLGFHHSLVLTVNSGYE